MVSTLYSNLTPLANFSTATDLNDATRNNCVYRFNTGTANNPGYNYGFCYAWTEGSNVHQLAVPRGGTSSIGMSERSRGSTGEWGEWVAIPTRAELTALNNSMAKVAPQKVTVSTSSGAASIDVTGMTASSAVVATVQRASNTDMNYRVYAQPASGKLWLYFRNSSDGTPADGTSITVSYSWA